MINCKNTFKITQEAVPELKERMTPQEDASCLFSGFKISRLKMIHERWGQVPASLLRDGDWDQWTQITSRSSWRCHETQQMSWHRPRPLWSAQIAAYKVSSGPLFTSTWQKYPLVLGSTINTILLGHPMASQVLGIAWADSVESSVVTRSALAGRWYKTT